MKLRNLPWEVDSSCLDGWRGGWNPIEVPNPAAGKLFTPLDVCSEKQMFVITIGYHFHASELLNLIFGWPGGWQILFLTFGPPRCNYDMQSMWIGGMATGRFSWKSRFYTINETHKQCSLLDAIFYYMFCSGPPGKHIFSCTIGQPHENQQLRQPKAYVWSDDPG